MAEKIVGSYTITRVIGQGGMAHVYCAVHRLMEREVALKLILPILLTEEQAQARFLREAKLLAKLEHPCIVPIYDSGMIENSEQLYLAMRLMKGGSLEERLKGQGKLSIAEYLPILRRVVDGLGFAHRHNIVHRDLKPGNILFDADGMAYLSDFGIAHVAQQTMQMTATGAKIGTPQYMAPEQFEGQAIDGRTDQYALAVMSYQVLSGRRPFEADTLIKLMKMHLMDMPPALTLPDRALGERLNGVLQKALAKEPDERYATCADFLQALSSAALSSAALESASQPHLSEATLLEATYIEPHSAQPKPATLPPAVQTPAVNTPTPASEPPRTPAETPVPAFPYKKRTRKVESVPAILAENNQPAKPESQPTSQPKLELPFALADAPDEDTESLSQSPELVTESSPVLSQNKRSKWVRWLLLAGIFLVGLMFGIPRWQAYQWQKEYEKIVATGQQKDIESTATAQALGVGSTQTRARDGMRMVYVPAGEFEMGSNDGDADEQPVHTVYLDAFWIDQTEVTNAQF
ncbi:MAG TPA: protein kinase, partial [Anaerolineales bacterium]|nr:protein kinase [Anaerolineales bacterium]